MCLLAAISPKAESLFGLPWLGWLTNSTFYAALVVGVVVAFVQVSLRRIELVPAGLQNFCEWVVETVHDILEGIVGKHMIGRTFPLLCTLFIFILSANLSALLPGVGTLGWGGGAGPLVVEVHNRRELDRALGLAVVDRGNGIPVAGVPHHQKTTYLQRALEAGFRVAVVEQCTYDGTILSAEQIVSRIGHLCDYILFDEAWAGFMKFHPLFRGRLRDGAAGARPRQPGIIVTQSTHKQLASFSQASQIHMKDRHIRGQRRRVEHRRFNESVLQHAS
ncbi:MAG: F0F1 ATP synthase subunit A, partial [Bdellovibrionaceae bacterium]|nr:F0F1 ATP synthase subunit A [Pseudobdellovibrionaceae bacterium]